MHNNKRFQLFLWLALSLGIAACSSDSATNNDDNNKNCTESTQRCANNTPGTCVDGEWLAAEICGTGFLCEFVSGNAQCVEDDVNQECTESLERCKNNAPETCQNGAWVTGAVCDKGWTCIAMETGDQCIEDKVTVECDEGEERCENNAPETCVNGHWTAGDACNDGWVCEINAGKAMCIDANPLEPIEVELDGNKVVVKTARMEVVIENATFISVTERSSGKVFSAPEYDSGNSPRGLAVVNEDNVENFRSRHSSRSTLSVRQNKASGVDFMLYPDNESEFTLKESGEFWLLTWKDLYDGENRHPEASMAMLIGQDNRGALTWQNSGTAPQGGVAGSQTPLLNIVPDAKFVVPFYGGMELWHEEGAERLHVRG